jgi:hypothetical protein
MHAVFYFKFVLANLSLALTLFFLFAKWPRLEGRPHGAIIAYYLARLVVIALALLKFHFGYPAENMGMYYFDAELVLKGAMPNRDFFTLYGVLFPYWLAGSVGIWHNRFAIVILLELVEFLAVYAIFTQRNVPLTLRSFLIFAFNPLVLVWIWLSVANQVMCLIAVAAAFALRSELARSLLFAVTFASSKVFALWTILPALMCQRVRSWFIFAIALVVIYVPFLYAGSTGISFKATEASGFITDDSNHTGVLSLVGLFSRGPSEDYLTKPVLAATAVLLLAVLLAAFWLRFRLGLGKASNSGMGKRDIIFVSAFSTMLTMVFQTFATYTIPDYFMGVIVLVPVLAAVNFWTARDVVLVLLVSYFQTVTFLVWFHFAEFGNPAPRTSSGFDALLIVENFFTFLLCARGVWRLVEYYRAELKGAR